MGSKYIVHAVKPINKCLPPYRIYLTLLLVIECHTCISMFMVLLSADINTPKQEEFNVVFSLSLNSSNISDICKKKSVNHKQKT